jgi:hypothetical protein
MLFATLIALSAQMRALELPVCESLSHPSSPIIGQQDLSACPSQVHVIGCTFSHTADIPYPNKHGFVLLFSSLTLLTITSSLFEDAKVNYNRHSAIYFASVNEVIISRTNVSNWDAGVLSSDEAESSRGDQLVVLEVRLESMTVDMDLFIVNMN